MKTDRKLGYEVKKYLIKKGVETPMVHMNLTSDEKIELISDNGLKYVRPGGVHYSMLVLAQCLPFLWQNRNFGICMPIQFV